jgi:hypothetical protein
MKAWHTKCSDRHRFFMIPSGSPFLPLDLPPPGSADRWPWLKALHRQPTLPLEPWLRALEADPAPPAADLLTVLVGHLDGPAAARLLAVWIRHAERRQPDAASLDLIGRIRDPACAALLRARLAASPPPELAVALLPVLGHQRDPVDFARLRSVALAPGPSRLRGAALEGLARGLAIWPRVALVRTCERLALDLDSRLAAAAVDLLARLPEGTAAIDRLALLELDPGVRRRLERRRQGRLRPEGRTPPEPAADCGARGRGG